MNLFGICLSGLSSGLEATFNALNLNFYTVLQLRKTRPLPALFVKCQGISVFVLEPPIPSSDRERGLWHRSSWPMSPSLVLKFCPLSHCTQNLSEKNTTLKTYGANERRAARSRSFYVASFLRGFWSKWETNCSLHKIQWNFAFQPIRRHSHSINHHSPKT